MFEENQSLTLFSVPLFLKGRWRNDMKMVWVSRIDIDKAKVSWSERVSLVANDIIAVLPDADGGARLVMHSAFSALGSTTWKETITVTTFAP